MEGLSSTVHLSPPIFLLKHPYNKPTKSLTPISYLHRTAHKVFDEIPTSKSNPNPYKKRKHFKEQNFIPMALPINNQKLNFDLSSGSVENVEKVFDEMPNRKLTLTRRDKGRKPFKEQNFIPMALPINTQKLNFDLSSGSVENVEKVFDEMPNRKLTLTRRDKSRKPFKEQNFIPMAVPINTQDVELSSGSTENADKVFDEMPKRKLKAKRKPFKEQDLFPITFPLHTQNPNSLYREIQRFAKVDNLDSAITILDYMDKKGIPVNVTTFSELIESCVRMKSLRHGKQIHIYVRINGLEENEYLCTKLVHMYTCCRSVEDAKRIFDELPSKSVYPWNALLRGNVVIGGKKYNEVLQTYTRMRELGIELNVYSFSCLIKSFAGALALNQGLKVHGILLKNGLLNSSILQTSLIDMYFKCGKIKLARHLFEETLDRDIVLWGAMVAGFAHNRLQKEALEYTRWMRREGIDPNSVILTTLLPVIGELGYVKLGQEAHAYVVKTKSYSKQLFIQSGLIDMYCKCGDMGSARKVFYASMERNTITWTALMSGYASNGRLDQALRSIIWMQQEGYKPDVVTVATVLPICAKLKALNQGKEVHAFAVKNGFLPNISVVTSLMVMYSRCGVLGYTVRLFQGLEKRNVIAWTAMIESYIENNLLHNTLDVFRTMQLSKHRPDSVSLSRMLNVCGQLRALKLGKEIHGQVMKRDLVSVPFVSSEIVKMYGVCGVVDKAKLAFDSVPVKGSMTWTAVIDAYGCNDFYGDAIELFEEMRSGGFTPNQYTFDVVLGICERAGFADEACEFINLMSERYNIIPSEENYSTVVSLLTRLGRVKEAQHYTKLKTCLLP